MRMLIVVASVLAAGAVGAAQLDSQTFNNLRRGMHESEVLLRAGEPDRVTAPGGQLVAWGAVSGDILQTGPRREFHYVPEPGEHDPWLTVVTLTNGRVSALERIRVPVSSVLPVPPPVSDEPSRAPSDDDIRRERAERTLRAAERYAQTRWRIRERSDGSASDTDGPIRPIYRGSDEQGTPYYGDVAPGNGPTGSTR